MRIYIDTSVIGGCFDMEFADWSNKLFSEFRNDKKVAGVSDQTLQELEKSPDQAGEMHIVTVTSGEFSGV